MKKKEQDLERFAAIVREYHRQDNYARQGLNPVTRTKSYQNACDTLQDEIGEKRMEEAREEYDERQFREAEYQADRRLDSHYQ